MTTRKKRPVMILDKHRGIYFGYLVKKIDKGDTFTAKLENARHCFQYGAGPNEQKGTYSLASYGPTDDSHIGPRINMTVFGCVKEIEITPEALERWEKATW